MGKVFTILLCSFFLNTCGHDGKTVTIATIPAHATPPPDTLFVVPVTADDWIPVCVEKPFTVEPLGMLWCVDVGEFRDFVKKRQFAN